MAHTFQVVIDCHGPHVLAEWWAETLEWQVEEQDESFIRSMLEQGHATEGETTRHRGRLVWREGAAIHPAADGSAADHSAAEASTTRQRILFQLVDEAKTIKNRVHLDVRPVGDVDHDEFRSALLARGATVVHMGRQGPHTWVTMADPEGNEFCV